MTSLISPRDPQLPRGLLEGGKTWASRNLRGNWWTKANIPGRSGTKRKAFHMNPIPSSKALQVHDERLVLIA